jgi:hypothetical protein
MDHRSERNGSPERVAYEAPRLVVYGDFRSLTLGGGGTKNEPGMGNPSTRA